jgi:hypothetical protein
MLRHYANNCYNKIYSLQYPLVNSFLDTLTIGFSASAGNKSYAILWFHRDCLPCQKNWIGNKSAATL